MSRKATELSSLETRKQLLLLESELNRAQLVVEWREVKKGINHLSAQAKALGSLASAATSLGSTVAGFFSGWAHQKKKSNDDGRPSFFSTILKGASAGISIWSALRSHMR